MERMKAFVVDTGESGWMSGVRELPVEALPQGELLVKTAYSSVNYKDALACAPNGNIVKTFPFVPGIDASGVVLEDASGRFSAGDPVLITGHDLGVSHYGGFAEYVRIPSEWAVPLPAGLSLKEAMLFGTAGLTAALSVMSLQDNGVRPEGGPVLVTGASGGVGGLAVALLARLGYEVAASTGKSEAEEELRAWGAASVISREAVLEGAERPLNKQAWAGAVDCVGGETLAALLTRLRYGGTVAASGLTGGTSLPTTVLPFILRGVKLIGIDSVHADADRRARAWELLAATYKPAMLASMSREIGLDGIQTTADAMLRGESRGRVIVAL
ncbi:oxidoreductase [Paenibacillus sp. TRM 82003]|nr:oxidoreductase [Paenibacillus sp. TRM 82003]